MRVKLSQFKLFLAVYVPVLVIIAIFYKYDVHRVLQQVLEPPNDVQSFESTLTLTETPIVDQSFSNRSHKLYYFTKKNLDTYVNVSNLPLLPKDDPLSDRLANQLIYLPPNYAKDVTIDNYKKIHLSDGPNAFYRVNYGTDNFKDCPVSTCNIIPEKSPADLVIFKNRDPKGKSHPDQIHMVYILESPYHYGNLQGPFDWTSTYRRDSDIVAPYGQWEYYDKRITQLPQTTNYATGKSKKIAWFVSNCHARNNRLEFAKQLNNTIQVDIYGYCSEQGLNCPRFNEQECLEMLEKDYKFYLAFENSNCRDYVTEKLFLNSLERKILPIVMGGTAEDYQKILPEKSFIHVDDFETPEHLGAYLELLDQDDELYNSYFKWRGTGELISTYYWCRVCSMLHIPNKDKNKYSLSDISFREWWQGDGVCKSKYKKVRKNKNNVNKKYYK